MSILKFRQSHIDIVRNLDYALEPRDRPCWSFIIVLYKKKVVLRVHAAYIVAEQKIASQIWQPC